MTRIFYQTLEKKNIRATLAGYCNRPHAWLGSGYYFWLNEDDAIRWGQQSKFYRLGHFETYKAEIFFDNVLNAVFNEKDYNFFLKTIEMAATSFIKKINERPTIKQLNDYLREKGIWESIDGILFQDLPKNEEYILVQELYYKKRIQLVVYKKDIILTFAFNSEGACLDD